jgi:hypothetical protein
MDAVEAAAPGSLADRIEVSHWRIELPEVATEDLQRAVAAFESATEVMVERLTKQGRRTFDCRAAVVRVTAMVAPLPVEGARYAILDLVVRQVTPAVRPDDVLSGLRVVADLAQPVPPRATRLAQGGLTAAGEIVDPLDADREASSVGR